MKEDNHTTKIPECRCQQCGYVFDMTTYPYVDLVEKREVRPNAGDVSICLCCGAIQIFNADRTLRNPTPEEKDKLDRDPRVTEIQVVRAGLVGDKLRKKQKL